MNNEQFRKLIASNSSAPTNGSSASPKPGSATPALGSRLKSSIPMTPRSLGGSKGGVDFRRQLAEQKAAGSEKTRKFRTAAPKGSRLAAGYVDRTRERVDEEGDEKAKRVRALEEQLKLGVIGEDVFREARDAIIGGDVGNVYLVKGLDFKLLERVRRGEDVLAEKAREDGKEEEGDLDGEFEELDMRLEVAPVVREKVEKKGEMASPVPVVGKKRTRDQILAELKEQRKAAAMARAEALAPKLGKGFKKIGGPEEPRIEVDARGREVLITVDAEGNVKRRVRKAPKQEQEILPDKDAEILGADVLVPEAPPPPPDSDDDDVDIFEDAGHDFNPLGDLGSDSEDEPTDAAPKPIPKPPAGSDEEGEIPSRSTSPKSTTENPTTSSAPRNYFNEDPSTLSVLSNLKNNLKDPTLLAALAKSRSLDPSKLTSQTETEEETARRKKHAAMINRDDRDMEDMDMGFGGSRFDDAEEMAGEDGVKLSKWKGLKGLEEEEGEEDGDGEGGKKKKRKRGGKRKGDKNDAGDVLKVMEKLKK